MFALRFTRQFSRKKVQVRTCCLLPSALKVSLNSLLLVLCHGGVVDFSVEINTAERHSVPIRADPNIIISDYTNPHIFNLKFLERRETVSQRLINNTEHND